MLASMYSAVSGLSAHQTKMNVIGNNIANVNTYGFKSSRATFSDVFYQTMKAASTGAGEAGGSNPTQLGYGARVASIDVINTRAGKATTDRALDVYIDGDGYLPVQDAAGLTKFTRVGVLAFDVKGNLVDGNGNKVLGLGFDSTTGKPVLGQDGTTTTSSLKAINIPPEELKKYSSISISPNGEIMAIKEGNPRFVAGQTSWISGAQPLLETSKLSGSVKVTASTPNANLSTTGIPASTGITAAVAANHDISGLMKVSYDGTNYTLKYTDRAGNAQSVDTVDTTPSLKFSVPTTAGGGAVANVTITSATLPTVPGQTMDAAYVVRSDMQIKVQTTNKAGETIEMTGTWTPPTDINTPSNITLTGGGETLTLIGDTKGISKMTTSDFTAMTSSANALIGNVGPGDGVPKKVAHLATASFSNQDGLVQDGQGYTKESVNSGAATITVPGSGSTGSTIAGALEMSNVDLSREFTDMIITQRGFQANTRMITVSDEMLQELVSMKR